MKNVIKLMRKRYYQDEDCLNVLDKLNNHVIEIENWFKNQWISLQRNIPFKKLEIRRYKKIIRFEYNASQKSNESLLSPDKLLAEKYFEEANELRRFQNKKYDEAEICYLKAIDLNPNHIDALNNYAQILKLNFKKYQKAIFYYTKVIDLNPRYQYAISRRGLCKEALGDYLGRIEDLTKLIELYPKNLDYYNSRAIVRSKVGDHKGTINDCSHVISLNKTASFPYKMRGISNVKLSNFHEGIKDLERAFKIEEIKSKSDINYKLMLFGILKYLVTAKLSIGDLKGAMDNANRFVKYEPNHPLPYKLRYKINQKDGKIQSSESDLKVFNKLNDLHFKRHGVSF